MRTTLRIACFILGLLCGGNGAAMLGWPARWYAVTPGALESGPLNSHFVRDIGAVYVLTGAAFMLAAARPRAGAPFVAAAALWLSAHAAIHLAELSACGDPGARFIRDLPGVHGPALLAAALAVLLTFWRKPHAGLAVATPT